MRLYLILFMVFSPFSLFFGLDSFIQNAHAEEKSFSGPQAFFLTGPSPIADGKTPVTYRFALINKDGSPMTDFRGKLNYPGGKATLQHDKNGLYSAQITPPAVDAKKEIAISVKGKGANGKISKKWTTRWLPAAQGTIIGESNPKEITLNQDLSASLNLKLNIPEASDAQLLLRSSVGKIENVTNLGDGTFSAQYIPPSKELYPHYALFSFIDARHPEIYHGSYVLPQSGRTPFPVESIPNSNVMLEIGDRKFGPVKADANGKASIPIIVPPGVEQATMISVIGGSTRRDTIDLQIPKSQKVLFFPLPQSIPADDSLKIPVRVLAITEKGVPNDNIRVKLSSSGGVFEDVQNIGNGIYEANFIPPLGNNQSTVTFTAETDDSKGKLADKMTINLIPSRASKISISPASTTLPKSTRNFSSITKVLGPNDSPLSNRTLFFIGQGVEPSPSRSLGNGDYSTKFTTTTNGPIELVSHLQSAPSKNRLSGFVLDSVHSRFENDGVSQIMLTVVSHDKYGSPVPNTAFQIEQAKGDGYGDVTVQSMGKTDGFGFTHFSITAGTKIGPVQIRIFNENVSSEYVLMQMPQTLAPHLVELPISGNETDTNLAQSWKDSIASVRIEREGSIGAKITGGEASSGVVNAIEVTVLPPKIAPNGVVTLQIKTVDNKGLPVSNAKLEAFSDVGEISKIQNTGGGNYTATLRAPETTKEEIKINVSTADNKVSKFLRLPVVQTEDIATTETPDESKKEKKQKKEKKKRVYEPTETQMLRISGHLGGGSYGYQQLPETVDGTLYGKSITFNNEVSGSSTAQTLGLGIRAKANFSKYHQAFKYVGFEFKYNTSLYSVALPEFTDPISDWVSYTDFVVQPMFPFTIQGMQLYVGTRLGYSMSDFMIFQQKETDDPDKVSLEYGPLPVSGILVGGEMGIELPVGVFADVCYDSAISGGVYQSQLQLSLGYTVTPDLFVELGAKSSIRNLEISGSSGAKIGELHDGNNTVFMGVGYQMK